MKERYPLLSDYTFPKSYLRSGSLNPGNKEHVYTYIHVKLGIGWFGMQLSCAMVWKKKWKPLLQKMFYTFQSL